MREKVSSSSLKSRKAVDSGADSTTRFGVIISVAFTFTVNLPLIISDVILAFGVRYLVKDATGDDHKADLAFAMVFLCPLLIGVTCITGMPDTFAATF